MIFLFIGFLFFSFQCVSCFCTFSQKSNREINFQILTVEKGGNEISSTNFLQRSYVPLSAV